MSMLYKEILRKADNKHNGDLWVIFRVITLPLVINITVHTHET